MAELDRAVWTDDDFEHMGWHGASIQRLHRSPVGDQELAATHSHYRIEGTDFDLAFTAVRYRQYFRARPIASPRQTQSAAQRGLPSFSIETFA